jgi:hypothetical protein
MTGEEMVSKTGKVLMGYEWSRKMEDAQVRCAHEAASEEILGYADNAKIYTEMAEEMPRIKWWVLGILGHDGYGAI